MTFYHLAKKLGYNVQREKNLHMTKAGKLLYPLKPLIVKKQKKLPNIVLLACESWRWDMLNPEITPATWKFAQKAHQFQHNYSAGMAPGWEYSAFSTVSTALTGFLS